MNLPSRGLRPYHRGIRGECAFLLQRSYLGDYFVDYERRLSATPAFGRLGALSLGWNMNAQTIEA
jgi:hypothetical protein